MRERTKKATIEVGGLLRSPLRTVPLFRTIISDGFRTALEHRHLYSFSKTKHSSAPSLKLLAEWILHAQNPNGGIAAYYSLLTGYAPAYPEVTGYLIPTLYDCEGIDARCANRAERATQWLISLQMPSGAFPAGLHQSSPSPSIFNSGQILFGLTRAYCETHRSEILRSAQAVGDWLTHEQNDDGSWSGPAAYQGTTHTYYSMVAWALAELSIHTGEGKYSRAAGRNLDWCLSHQRPSGWFDRIDLQGHPNYLHFIAYILQGALESAIRLGRVDAVGAIANSAWTLLRKFEAQKSLAGAYDADFKNGWNFTCLTGNAQMSCVWLRLFEVTADFRYLNASLKMNEMLKNLMPRRGPVGILGGIAGSYPIWGRYQPFRYVSWGCKFFADALLLEDRLLKLLEIAPEKSLACA